MILLAALALSQVDPIALGRARADFGDIPNGGKWKFVFTSQFGGTEIYFPSGRADVRFYLVGLNGGGLRICKQSKRDGKIRKDWLFEVKDSSSSSKTSTINGTLGAIVSRYGVPKNISAEARTDLASKGSFAVFHPQGGHSGPIYTFLKYGENPLLSDGSEARKLRTDWITDFGDRIPRTKSPYPITPEELDEIKKGIAPAKN
jgi:hypothetical protein